MTSLQNTRIRQKGILGSGTDAISTARPGAPLPLFGALAAVLFGGEALTLKAALGMTLTVGGIVLLTA